MPAKVCRVCNFIEITIDASVDRICKKCGHSGQINLSWLPASIIVLWDYFWDSYVRYFDLKRNESQDPFAANKEGLVVLVISDVIKELILQKAIEDIYYIYGAKGALYTSGEGFGRLAFAYRLLTGKTLKEEIGKICPPKYVRYEKDTRQARNNLIHTGEKVFSVSEDEINKAVGVTCESISVAAKLVNAEVEIKLA
jgi:hypothetical protein